MSSGWELRASRRIVTSWADGEDITGDAIRRRGVPPKPPPVVAAALDGGGRRRTEFVNAIDCCLRLASTAGGTVV